MKVFINPGHAPNGNPDPGAVGMTGLRESDVAYTVGTQVAQYLNGIGIETAVLQSDDLWEVCNTANNSGVDLFISIHCNAAESLQANGTETFCYPNSDTGYRLAECIQNQIVDNLGTSDRGVKFAVPGQNGLYVISNTDMPAVLVELAFISNADDEALLTNQQTEFARCIARGVTDSLQ